MANAPAAAHCDPFFSGEAFLFGFYPYYNLILERNHSVTKMRILLQKEFHSIALAVPGGAATAAVALFLWQARWAGLSDPRPPPCYMLQLCY